MVKRSQNSLRCHSVGFHMDDSKIYMLVMSTDIWNGGHSWSGPVLFPFSLMHRVHNLVFLNNFGNWELKLLSLVMFVLLWWWRLLGWRLVFCLLFVGVRGWEKILYAEKPSQKFPSSSGFWFWYAYCFTSLRFLKTSAVPLVCWVVVSSSHDASTSY